LEADCVRGPDQPLDRAHNWRRIRCVGWESMESVACAPFEHNILFDPVCSFWNNSNNEMENAVPGPLSSRLEMTGFAGFHCSYTFGPKWPYLSYFLFYAATVFASCVDCEECRGETSKLERRLRACREASSVKASLTGFLLPSSTSRRAAATALESLVGGSSVGETGHANPHRTSVTSRRVF
jgi:hypothetical protein